MATKIKIFECKRGHKILSSSKNEKRFEKGTMVCGTCQTNFSEYKSATWSAEKHFICKKGHIITISPFANGTCNFSWGNGETEYVNLIKSPEELSEMLENGRVMCPAGSPCNNQLIPLEDCNLSVPKLMVAKTKIRVGDIWDKHKYPEPKAGHYDKDYIFHETEFSKKSKERVKSIRERRNTRPAGEVVDKPTKRSYRTRDPKPRKEDL